jgi:tol-pal system protein YbgF
MHKTHSHRNPLFAAALFAIVLFTLSTPARASKDQMVELQTQVQQLLDMVQRLQSTMDSRFAVLQHLAEQTADNANQMSATVTALQQKIAAQNDAASGKLDTASGQVQALNDSVDELKSRIAKLDKSIQDMQAQLQNIQNPPAAQAGTGPGGPGAPGGPAAAGVAAQQTPPLKETFQSGMSDYNAAKYEVASGEFQDVIHYYPMDELAGASQFYLGEIAYRQKDYADAVKAYNAVLEGFPGNAKAPAAQLRKGLALLQLGKKDAGITELKLLIKRHPQTPEAAQAKSKLGALGVHSTAR